MITNAHQLINETATQQCENTIPMFNLGEPNFHYALSEKYGNGVAFNFSCALMNPQPPADFKTFADYLEHLIQAERKIEAEDPIQF
jgi:hypothetical protein